MSAKKKKTAPKKATSSENLPVEAAPVSKIPYVPVNVDPEKARKQLIERAGFKEDELKVLCPTDDDVVNLWNAQRQLASVGVDDEAASDDYKLTEREKAIPTGLAVALAAEKNKENIRKLLDNQKHLPEDKRVTQEEARSVADLLADIDKMEEESS